AGARHTAFTGALLGLLRDGDPHGPRWLTLKQVYRSLAVALPAAGLPRPQSRTQGRIENLVLAANPAWRPLSGTPSTPLGRPQPTAGVCPYKGLAAFDEADQMWFHGREALVARLVARLANRLDDPRPLVVTGTSGSGKSSLLRAGLLGSLGHGTLGVPGSSSWPRRGWSPPPRAPGGGPGRAAYLAAAPAEAGPAADARRAASGCTAAPGPGRCDQAGPPEAARRSDGAGSAGRRPARRGIHPLRERTGPAGVHTRPGRPGHRCGRRPRGAGRAGVRGDFYGRCTTYPDLAGALESVHTVDRRPFGGEVECAGAGVEDLVGGVMLQFNDEPRLNAYASGS